VDLFPIYNDLMTMPAPQHKGNLPTHVAIIMDGNGRWAKRHGLSRVKGHEKGAESVRNVVEVSREVGIPWLTLYAFSEENWKRPTHEIKALMRLLEQFLNKELQEMCDKGIRLKCIGRIQKLPKSTAKLLEKALDKTSANQEMTLTLALSYGGRQEILDAVKRLASLIERGHCSAQEITEKLFLENLYLPEMPDPDLLIRTGGECRVSNFLLWQCAYTEFYFTPTLWPEFGRDEFLQALSDYQRRERRFGAVFD